MGESTADGQGCMDGCVHCRWPGVHGWVRPLQMARGAWMGESTAAGQGCMDGFEQQLNCCKTGNGNNYIESNKPVLAHGLDEKRTLNRHLSVQVILNVELIGAALPRSWPTLGTLHSSSGAGLRSLELGQKQNPFLNSNSQICTALARIEADPRGSRLVARGVRLVPEDGRQL
jgi:hypothetical protein